MAQRQQILEPVGLLGEDDRDRIAARRQLEGALAASRRALAGVTPDARRAPRTGPRAVASRPRARVWRVAQTASSSSGDAIFGLAGARRVVVLVRGVVMALTVAGSDPGALRCP